jgi:hypothetical protein
MRRRKEKESIFEKWEKIPKPIQWKFNIEMLLPFFRLWSFSSFPQT